MGYMYEPKGKHGAARREHINCSHKDLCNVCENIRGMLTEDAVPFMESAAAGEIPIRFKTHNKRMAHRRELGGKKGRWPIKASKFVLDVLKNAVANAEAKGLFDTRVAHAAANKQHIYNRLAPRGTMRRNDYETAFIEIVLEESNVISVTNNKDKEVTKKVEKSIKKKDKEEVKKEKVKINA